MPFLLTVQFQGDTIGGFDEMVALENELIVALGETAEIDGHDIGSGEINIFIVTDDPSRTFQDIKPVLERLLLLDSAAVAFRPTDSERYTIIWPKDKKSEFRLA